MTEPRPLAEAPYLDPFTEEFEADPRPIMKALREQTSVIRSPIGCLVITRAAVHDLFLDPAMRSAMLPFMRMAGLPDGPLHDLFASTVAVKDGEDHARLRRLVSPYFTPKAVAPHRPMMRDLVESLVDPIAPAGECEFMADVAAHYPIQVICHLLGVPKEDHEQFAQWGDALTYVLGLSLTQHLEETLAAAKGLIAYIGDLLADRRAHPQDDLVSQLIAARDGADRLDELELTAMIGGLLFAGYDTTRNQLGLAMNLFCDHPDQWRMVAERPEVVPAAVEEIMRFAGATSMTPRIASDDIVVDGWLIPAGTIVGLSLTSANYDVDVYDKPFEFDITATREAHMTLGAGPHHCLGANLARAELQEALPVLARRMPDLERVEDAVWRRDTGIFGPETLSLRFRPEAG
jgi:cytochrome P450